MAQGWKQLLELRKLILIPDAADTATTHNLAAEFWKGGGVKKNHGFLHRRLERKSSVLGLSRLSQPGPRQLPWEPGLQPEPLLQPPVWCVNDAAHKPQCSLATAARQGVAFWIFVNAATNKNPSILLSDQPIWKGKDSCRDLAFHSRIEE